MAAELITIGSPCPRCKSDDCWYEIGGSDKPGYMSVRLHCKHCGHVVKNDVREHGDLDWPGMMEGC